ncbi:TPA: rhomboid family intramembrane serine protease [archaeon]|nr:rhomboid family intramembrane serine protease [Candidatus Naiadarchaeales archaeon SRR2090159.bin1288]
MALGFLNFEGKMQWLALKISAAIFVFFILQVFIGPLTEALALYPYLAVSQPWRLITHMFAHGGIEHLFYNLFALALFGTILEKIIGWRRFLSLFFVGGLAASIGTVVIYTYLGFSQTGSVGASGAIMAIIGTLAILRPRMIVYVTFIPLPMILAAVFWALLDILGAFNPFSTTNNYAHLVGLGFGIVYGLILHKYFGEPLFLKEKESPVGKKELDEWERRWM